MEDYYLKGADQEEHCRWLGKGAESLKLVGQVREEEFRALCAKAKGDAYKIIRFCTRNLNSDVRPPVPPHARFDEGGQGKACSLLYPRPFGIRDCNFARLTPASINPASDLIQCENLSSSKNHSWYLFEKHIFFFIIYHHIFEKRVLDSDH